MIEYSLLNKHILSMANSGTTDQSFHRTIEESCLVDGGCFGSGLGMAAVGFGGRYLARTMPHMARRAEEVNIYF